MPAGNSGYSPAALVAVYNYLEDHLSSMRRGGIYAYKSGYHSSYSDNKRRWPGDYSTVTPADRRGDKNASAGIDISLNSAEMKIVTKRLIDACRNGDKRMEPVREVLGTLNDRTVTGWNRVATGYGSRGRVGYVSSDSSHLWHVHISILRAYATNKAAMRGVAEVCAGVKGGSATPGAPSSPTKPAKDAGWYHVNPKEVDTTLLGLNSSGKKKVSRRSGFNIYGTKIVTKWGRRNLMTRHGTYYALAFLAKGKYTGGSGKPKPEPTPSVSLKAAQAAARQDPDRKQGGATKGSRDDVMIVEEALQRNGLLNKKYAYDGSFGTATVTAYAAWQRSKAGGGHRGGAADGIPGRASLVRLGKKYKFTVKA